LVKEKKVHLFHRLGLELVHLFHWYTKKVHPSTPFSLAPFFRTKFSSLVGLLSSQRSLLFAATNNKNKQKNDVKSVVLHHNDKLL